MESSLEPVTRWNILLRTDDKTDLAGISSRDAFKFLYRVLFRIDAYTTFGAAMPAL